MIDYNEIPTLHVRLAALTLRDVARKRAAMARMWPRLLYTGVYGSYLGEKPGGGDAFESLVDVLRLRLDRRRQRGEGTGGGGDARGAEEPQAGTARGDPGTAAGNMRRS